MNLKIYNAIRPSILIITTTWAIVLWLWMRALYPAYDLQVIRIAQGFGFTAVSLIYLVLLISPLTMMWTSMPGRAGVIHARRALGVSAWGFAVLHATLEFFILLGGFPGWAFLSTAFRTAVLLGLFNIVVLSIMAATSFDVLEKSLGRKWKIIHRFIYLVGALIVIHVLMIGTHYTNLGGLLPRVSALLLAILLFLESWRLDRWLRKPTQQPTTVGWAMVVLALIIGYGFSLALDQHTTTIGLHAGHVVGNPTTSGTTTTPPANVRVVQPKKIEPNTPANFKFFVTSPTTGAPVQLFATLFEKQMHTIFVRDDFTQFMHVHPTVNGNGEFDLTQTFTEPGSYHGYLNFEPLGGKEQQFAFTFHVGTSATPESSVDADVLATSTDGIRMKLTASTTSAAQFSAGTATMTFTLTDAYTGRPVTTVQPYLGAFGHLSMIDTDNYRAIHVHPKLLVATPGSTTGPTIEFLPLGLNGAITPGRYVVFVEFQINGQVKTGKFVVTLR